LLSREVGLPALATVVLIASADIRIPIGLPGHRGLVWLTLLVTVVLMTRVRQTVVAVGAASTVATALLHTSPGMWASARYLSAALLLYAVAFLVTGHRRWVIALAAAPIHLVALAGAVSAGFRGGYLPAFVSPGLTEKALLHLGFGLVAGLLGWAIASSINRFSSVNPTGTFGDSPRRDRCHGSTSRSRGAGRDECGRGSHYSPAGGRAYRGGADDLSGGATCG
jgi:hypothetical protein